MYNVLKGPSKFIPTTRIGGGTTYFENGPDVTKKADLSKKHNGVKMQMIEPISIQLNTEKLHNMAKQVSDENITSPEHEEIVKYVSESWNSFERRSKNNSSNINKGKVGSTPVYYCPNETNNKLKDFVPFDFESWRRNRIVSNITQ